MTRSTRWLVALALLLAAASLVAVCVGSTGGIGWPPAAIRAGRLERAWLAALVGVGLGGAGAIYQAVLRNDLADPYLLGVASGAALASYVHRLLMLYASLGVAGVALSHQALTFAGAIAAAGVVLAMGGVRRAFDPATVVLCGVTVSTMCGAAILLIFTLAKTLPADGTFQSLFVGEIRTVLGPAERAIATLLVVAPTAIAAWRGRRLNVLALSDDEARSLGLRVGRERLIQLALASLVTAAVVSIAGPVGFVGLIAPHVMRRLIGDDARSLVVASAIGGAILVLLADALLRGLSGVPAINAQIPLGVATALLGGPFFLSLLGRRDRGAA